MNEYSTMVQDYYDQAKTPAAERNPRLAEEIQGQVTTLFEQLEMSQQEPPDEGYLAKVARLNGLRMQAEEIVLADLLPPVSESLEGEDEDGEPLVGLTAVLVLGPTDPDHPLNSRADEMSVEEYRQTYRAWAAEQRARYPKGY